jgi:hypothetical protein
LNSATLSDWKHLFLKINSVFDQMKEILNKGASLRFILRQTDPSKFVVIINNGKEETRLLVDLTMVPILQCT